MKRLISALVVCTIAVGICIVASVTINKFSRDLEGLIDESIEACENQDYEAVNEIFGEIKEKWNEYSKTLELFSGHGNIHTISQSIERMEALLEIEDYKLYIVECRAAVLEIGNIAHSESVGLINLM